MFEMESLGVLNKNLVLEGDFNGCTLMHRKYIYINYLDIYLVCGYIKRISCSKI